MTETHTPDDVAALAEVIKQADRDGVMSSASLAQVIALLWRPKGPKEQPRQASEWSDGQIAWVTRKDGIQEICLRRNDQWVSFITPSGEERGIHDRTVTRVEPVETHDEHLERENDDLRRQLSEQRAKTRNYREQIALLSAGSAPDVAVQITDNGREPTSCTVTIDGVLRFSGVAAQRLREYREDS